MLRLEVYATVPISIVLGIEPSTSGSLGKQFTCPKPLHASSLGAVRIDTAVYGPDFDLHRPYRLKVRVCTDLKVSMKEDRQRGESIH